MSADFPSELQASSSTLVTLHFTNRGNATWTPEEVALAPTPRDVPSDVCDPSWPSCTRAAPVSGTVAPGEEGEFSVLVQGPAEPGLVQVCFGLAYGNHWFSDPGEMGPADDAICPTFDVVAGTSDAGTSDAGTSDASTSDAGTSDAGVSADGGGLPDEVLLTGGCSCRVARGATAPPGAGAIFFVLGLVGVLWRRRGRRRTSAAPRGERCELTVRIPARRGRRR